MKWRAVLALVLVVTAAAADGPPRQYPGIPADYLREPAEIPVFWKSTVDDVNRFLDRGIHSGTVFTLGRTAGKRAIRGVAYGRARIGTGTTTFSGSLGYGGGRTQPVDAPKPVPVITV